MNKTQNEYQMYLDYINNFLTVEAFAEHYDISYINALRIIENGRKAATTTH